MCKVMEDMCNEVVQMTLGPIASKLYEKSHPLESIAALLDIPVEEVKRILKLYHHQNRI